MQKKILIHFLRTGGFAGLRKAFTLDTGSLPSEEARKLEEMVNASGFFNLPEKFPPPKRGADYFLYRVTVEVEGKRHTVEVSEPSMPEKLRPLLQFLSKYSK